MIIIVMNKDIAPAYARIDDAPEPYYPEPMGSEGDNWVEINIEDEESTDVDYIASTYNININHIIAIGVCDDEGEINYKTTGE